MANPFSEISSKIRQRITSNAGGLPVMYENMPKEQVRDVNGLMPNEFIYVDIMFASSEQVSIGNPNKGKHRYAGVVSVHIFTQIATGDGRAYEIADAIGNAIKSSTLDNITYRASNIDAGSLANDKDGKYWRITLATPFFSDYYE